MLITEHCVWIVDSSKPYSERGGVAVATYTKVFHPSVNSNRLRTMVESLAMTRNEYSRLVLGSVIRSPLKFIHLLEALFLGSSRSDILYFFLSTLMEANERELDSMTVMNDGPATAVRYPLEIRIASSEARGIKYQSKSLKQNLFSAFMLQYVQIAMTQFSPS